MKTSEFKETLKNSGYEVFYHDGVIDVLDRIDDCVGNLVAVVHLKDMYFMDMTWGGISSMEESKRVELFDLVVEYASTPIAEREEEKRYRLKLINKTVDESVSYLSKIKEKERYFVSSNIHFVDGTQTIFTESELKHIDETGFERKEVEQ